MLAEGGLDQSSALVGKVDDSGSAISGVRGAAHAQGILHWNEFMSISAWCLGLAQIPFIINFFWSMKKGKKVVSNPWEATTLEWAATTSPPLAHGNFEKTPEVYRGPYDYSIPGHKSDFTPQNQFAEA